MNCTVMSVLVYLYIKEISKYVDVDVILKILNCKIRYFRIIFFIDSVKTVSVYCLKVSRIATVKIMFYIGF